MPDVMVVVEVEQFTFLIIVPGLSRLHVPCSVLVQEEVHSRCTTKARQKTVGQRLTTNPLTMPELHEYVEGAVEEEVDDEDPKQESSKVRVPLCHYQHPID